MDNEPYFITRDLTLSRDEWKILDDIIARNCAGIGTLAGMAIKYYYSDPDFIELRKKRYLA